MHTHIHYLKPNQTKPIQSILIDFIETWQTTINSNELVDFEMDMNWISVSIEIRMRTRIPVWVSIWFYLQIPKEKRKFSIKTRFKRITSNWIEFGWSFSSWILFLFLHIDSMFWVSVCRFNEFHLQSEQIKQDNVKKRTNKPLKAMQFNEMYANADQKQIISVIYTKTWR